MQEFWNIVVSVWTEGFMGVDVGTILTALLIFLGFLVLRGMFAAIIMHQIRFWTKRTATEIDDQLVDALGPPISFIPVVLGFFFASQQFEMDGMGTEVILSINRSLVAFTIFWGFYRLIPPLGAILEAADNILTSAMVEWIVKALKLAIILVGGATILELWGIKVMPLIAGLGLFGVAVALGAQDLFKNLIAGLFVIGERRFHKGDWILVEGIVEGTVEQIGFRTTKVRRFDKAPVYVPNAKLSDNAVTNFSEMTHRRIKWLIGIEYATTKEQLRQVRDEIENYLISNDAFAKPDEVSTFVRIDRFSDSSIDILLYCFTKTTNWGEWLEIKEELALKIKEIVEGAGTGFAFPSRSIYLQSQPDAPEIFPGQEPTP